jgi:hypothetical protein
MLLQLGHPFLFTNLVDCNKSTVRAYKRRSSASDYLVDDCLRQSAKDGMHEASLLRRVVSILSDVFGMPFVHSGIFPADVCATGAQLVPA